MIFTCEPRLLIKVAISTTSHVSIDVEVTGSSHKVYKDFSFFFCDNNGGNRPAQLPSTCNSRFKVLLEQVYLLRICPRDDRGIFEYSVKQWLLLNKMPILH